MKSFVKRGMASTLLASVAVVGVATSAQARAVQIEQPDREVMHRNAVVYTEHVEGRWTYAELRDGSTWMVTRCAQEDSTNCYWNAAKRGNGQGHSFVNLGDHVLYVVR